jgi:transcriptional regulator with XRE-family HTH domain
MGKRTSAQNRDLSMRVGTAFGARLKRARSQAVPPVSQETLAKALDVTRTSVSNIENGRHRVFLDQLFAAARSLGLPASALLPDEEDVIRESAVRFPTGAGITYEQLRELDAVAAAAADKATKQLSERARAERRR